MNAEPDLPSWTSQAVAALGPAQAGLLGRLTSEPRMKRVWRELGRRRRSDGARLYPVGAGILLLIGSSEAHEGARVRYSATRCDSGPRPLP